MGRSVRAQNFGLNGGIADVAPEYMTGRIRSPTAGDSEKLSVRCQSEALILKNSVGQVKTRSWFDAAQEVLLYVLF
jgi:hypothetical protein